MRKLIFSILIFAGILLFGSCKKVEIPSDIENLGVGSYLTLLSQTNTRIDYSNISTTSVQEAVRQYGSAIEKIKIYVTKGSVTLDRSAWKLVKEVSYSGDSVVLNVKATEIAAALGVAASTISPGNSYTLYNQVITKDGDTFDVANTYPDFVNTSNYNMALTWTAVVVCPFVSTGFAGNFIVLQDDWADYTPGDIVPVALGPGANQISITLYPGGAYPPSNRVPIKVDIDPATGAATVAPQVYGDYSGEFITAKSVGTNNYVFTCVGTITLRLNHTGAGNYGDYTIRLLKQ